MICRGEGTSLASLSYTYTVYDGENAYLQVTDTAGQGVLPSCGRFPSAICTVRQSIRSWPRTFAPGRATGVLWGLADYDGTICDMVSNSGTEVTGGHVQFNSFGEPINGTASRWRISSSAWTACPTIRRRRSISHRRSVSTRRTTSG